MPPKKPSKAEASTAAAAPAMATTAVAEIADTPPALENPDTIATYKALYDTLGRAYWEASDINAKDTIQGARDAIYDIITDLNIAALKANTALYLAVIPKIRQTNSALEKIKGDIGSITKNINTASTVIVSITKVLNLIGKL